MLFPSLRLAGLLLAAGLALGYAATLAWPVRYAATASVLMPEAPARGSRVLRIEDIGGDAHTALSRVQEQLRVYVSRKAQVLDAPFVQPQRPSLALNLALGALAGLGLAAALAARRLRRPPPKRVSPWSTLSLCAQLRAGWLGPERPLLAIVAAEGDGAASARLAQQLAAAFADLGQRTLLIDGDLRAPALHREYGLRNRGGLAGLVQKGRVELARVRENLSVVVAGEARGDPLELLAHRRLRAFLADARQHFAVVLLHAPPAGSGPDYEMFAALAGGVLVLGAPDGLQARLERCGAQVVATVDA